MRRTTIFILLLALTLLGCEERVVRRSGMYSSDQYGNVPSASRGVMIVPPPQPEPDPLSDLWSLIMSPFRAIFGNDSSNTTPQGQTINLPNNISGEVPVKDRDGQNYNLRFEQGEYKSATPAPAPRPAPSNDGLIEK